MLTKRIENLFDFIDYLHLQINYFKSKEVLIDELANLLQQKKLIKPSENYKNKIIYDSLQKQVEEIFFIVEAEIINPIKNKITELDIADISTPIVNLKAHSDLFDLQNKFQLQDLDRIFSARKNYLEFRQSTKIDYYLQFFFFELDRTLKEFYDYFKDENSNEFEDLDSSVINVENIDAQGIEKALRKLTGNINQLHFNNFSEFLDYFKNQAEGLHFDTEPFRLLQLEKHKLEVASFQKEVDDVKVFCENAIKDLKSKLLLSFTNENYKTKVNNSLNPRLLEISKLYAEYEILYEIVMRKQVVTENYRKFTLILSRLYEENFDFNIPIDYIETTTQIITEIKEKLYSLQNNDQRLGFLKTVFRGFFDNGKDFHFYQMHKLKDVFVTLPENKKEYTYDEFNFLQNCLSLLSEVVLSISEEVLIYNIDFADIMMWSWRHSENGKQNPYEVFVYYSNGKIYSATEVESDTIYVEKYSTKQYVITYILDNYASGEKLPHGNKMELEKIGSEFLGEGRGNTFYKNFNNLSSKDLRNEAVLEQEAGHNWRQIFLKLSKDKETLDNYLKANKI